MELAIDIGGTKTILAVFNAEGALLTSQKFPTNQDYQKFKEEMAKAAQQLHGHYDFQRCCCAAPGRIDHQNGSVVAFGRLTWRNVPLKSDLESLLDCPVVIENDAKLAGLSEAILLKDKYRRVQYLTLSTGIGGALIVDGQIDHDLWDTEPGQMKFEHGGELKKWEDFASGRAIVEHYGKMASEIDDPDTWEEICDNLAIGIYDVIANIQPEVIVIGGGVGAHFAKFGSILNAKLQKLGSDLVTIPPVVSAQRAEEAVIYGCHELLQQNN